MTKSNTQKQRLLFTLICLTVMLAAKAQNEPLKLKDAIEMAMKTNAALKADSLGIAESAYRNRETAGRMLPQISYSSVTEYNPAIPSQLLPGAIAGQSSKDLVPVTFGTRYNVRSGIEVNQALIRKDLSVQIKAAGLYTTIAKTKYRISKEELAYQVAASYYDLQADMEMIRTTTSDYNNIRDVLIIAKAQFESGTLKKIDYQSLQINLANKQSQLNNLQTQYHEHLAWFNYLLGLPADTITHVYQTIAEVNHLQLPYNQVSGRYDLRLSQHLIRSKEVDINAIQAEKSPVVNSYFRYNMQSQFNNTSNAFDKDYSSKSSTVGISMSFSIFDGNRRKSRLHVAQIQLDQLRWQSKQQYDQAKTQWVTASKTFYNSKSQLDITKENLELAENVFSSRKALYTQGVSTLVELLDADRELSQARNHHVQAMIDVQKAWLEVHKANGTLLSEFLKSL